MPAQKALAEIFSAEPTRWGLRGDPFLWQEMKSRVSDHEYPETEQQLITLLEQTYRELTGDAITNDSPIFIERYNQGGMSSGVVSPQFWSEQAIPLLLSRYRESK